MKKIITNRAEAVKKGMLKDGRYFIHLQSGTALYLPIWYGHRLDLKNMLITENEKEIEQRTDLPDLNQLIKEGYIIDVNIFRAHDIFLAKFKNCRTRKVLDDDLLAALQEEFRNHGFNVTADAIRHNYNAWLADHKSGYRDQENGYHLFTPCGCNPLSFRVASIEPELDWQWTYDA